MTFDANDVLLIPTAHLRFVLREVTEFDISKNGYEHKIAKILQQRFEPHQRYAGVFPGEWRDVPLVTSDDES